ncbi:hypothetical protein LJC31_06815 [Synergistaceae bacterium OttesenSCG-928-I11]|nr:hypothetical protein [Synergistaceae bacterium OttesenSCG-928-I11]
MMMKKLIRQKKMTHTKSIPDMTPEQVVFIILMDKYLQARLDPFISLLELHRLMYFMQEAGEPLCLNYEKTPYGPCAVNLHHILHAIEGHFVLGYADSVSSLYKLLEAAPEAVRLAKNKLSGLRSTKTNLTRVERLVHGFETPDSLELLAILHWINKKECATTLTESIDKIYQWTERKYKFPKGDIEIAFDVLTNFGWLSAVQ